MNDVPGRVGVVGGGRMGAGIAQVFAARGSQVVLAEAADQQAALDRVLRGLGHAADREVLDGQDPVDVLARVRTVGGPEDLPSDLDLVIEAVPERADLKVDVLAAIDRRVSGDTVIATNTSSLSIGELSVALEDRTRFVGMHFFNPVPASTLVEIVRTPDTADDVIATIRRCVTALGKREIVVNDSPGFATSRLGVCLGLEAIRMIADGVADAESIDAAMELGYRHPMGPLRSTDLVGLDVRLAIAEHLAGTLGDRFEPPQLLRTMVADGHLGRKSGQGFYSWEGSAR